MCDKRYTHTNHLRTHKASEHEGVRYPCDQCYYQAKQKGHLRSHIKKQHSDQGSQSQ